MDKNNTKIGIKKNKKLQEDGGYKGSRFLTPNSSHSRYPLDSSYPYYSSILSRPSV